MQFELLNQLQNMSMTKYLANLIPPITRKDKILDVNSNKFILNTVSQSSITMILPWLNLRNLWSILQKFNHSVFPTRPSVSRME